jgi:hypothetical protein
VGHLEMVARRSPRSRRQLAPANPALPTAGGLPSVDGYPASARAGLLQGEEPAGAEGSSQSHRGAGRALPCSSPITSYGKGLRPRRSLRDQAAERVQNESFRSPFSGSSPGEALAAGPPPGGGRERRRTTAGADRLAATAPSRQSDGRSWFDGKPSRADEGGGPDAGADTTVCGLLFRMTHTREEVDLTRAASAARGFWKPVGGIRWKVQ